MWWYNYLTKIRGHTDRCTTMILKAFYINSFTLDRHSSFDINKWVVQSEFEIMARGDEERKWNVFLDEERG